MTVEDKKFGNDSVVREGVDILRFGPIGYVLTLKMYAGHIVEMEWQKWSPP